MIKKLLTIILSLTIVLSILVPLTFAEEGDIEEGEQYDTFGDNAPEEEDFSEWDNGGDEPDEISDNLDSLTEDTNSELDSEELGDTPPDGDGAAGGGTEGEEEELKNTSMPTIPKPDLLPGPVEGSSQKDVQTYFKQGAIPTFIAYFIGVIGLMAFISMIISGIMFLTAFGNEERVGAAKKTVMFAIVGFLLAILAYAIVSIIGSLQLGVDILHIDTAFADEGTTVKEEIDAEVSELLPSQWSLIEASPNAQGTSLPEGTLQHSIIPQIINILLYLASTVMFITIVYAGILLATARGNEETINKAQDIIIYALTGILIIAASYALIYGIAKVQF